MKTNRKPITLTALITAVVVAALIAILVPAGTVHAKGKKFVLRISIPVLNTPKGTRAAQAPSSWRTGAEKPNLAKESFELAVGETAEIGINNIGKAAKVKFKSSDGNVAKVSKDGTIKAVSQGRATVKAVVKKKNGKKTKLTCTVTVTGKKDETKKPVVSPLFTGDRNGQLSDGFCAQTTDFAVRIFRENAAQPLAKGDNYLISPLSILTDLMMAANGAEGSTLSEMEKTCCGSVGFEAFRKQLSDYNARLIASDDVSFNIANSIWIRDDADRLRVNDVFLNENEKYFNADSYVLPFDSGMVKKVNAWVNENTGGMIPVLMEDVPPAEDVMHLINAIAFEAGWMEPYQSYMIEEGADFRDSKGMKEKAIMLRETMGSYLSDSKAKGFMKSYKGGGYSFVAILPDENVSVTDYLDSMTGDSFRAFIRSGKGGCDVHTKLPEFTFDYTTEMSDDLKRMGIRKAFAENAEFGKMAKTRTGELFIGQVVHKTHIELDRKGTKAAAVTDIGMKDTATAIHEKEQVYIYLDRPFICAIIQNETGIPVFMGAVNSVGQ